MGGQGESPVLEGGGIIEDEPQPQAMTDEQKAQRLLDRASRRLTGLEQAMLMEFIDGLPMGQSTIDRIHHLFERFAADLA